MAVTQDDIKRLRRMIVEPTEASYTDSDLTALLENTACTDVNGKDPTATDWVATYNIFQVASEIWLEKSAAVADEFDFNADGGDFKRSPKQLMAVRQAAYFEGRSKALSLQMKQTPLTKITTSGWEDLAYNDEIDDHEANLT